MTISSTASINLSIANFRTQVLGSLMNLGSDEGSSFGNIISQFQAGNDNPLAALSDPQSAYAMMTRINGLDVAYKGQYSELSQMDTYLPRLAEAAQQLGKTGVADANDSITAQIQDFAQQYNAWVQRFHPDVQGGGVLDNVQAGELPLYELDQVIENRFIGAKDGLQGLADLGISVDAKTGLMSVDAGQLDTALRNNKPAVVGAVQEFSAKFASEAQLLASDDNLIQHRLNNLKGAIAYIDGNVGNWQQEFGSGDAANPTGNIAQALAAYNNASAI